MNKFKSLIGIFAFSLLFLGMMPMTASAQYGDILGGIFGRRNDRNRDVYNRNRDVYNRRSVESAISRVKNRADDFRDALDRALDNSRYDGRRREDRILDVAKDFERAARRLDDRYDDRRSNRNDSDVRNLLQIGSQLDSFVYRQGRNLDRRVENEWSGISNDLQTIAYAYGYNFGSYNNRRNGGIYDDDEDYRNNRRKRRDRDDDNRRNRDYYPF